MKRKKRILEKYDKKTGKWISVPFDNANDEMIRIYEMMEAELEITANTNQTPDPFGITFDFMVITSGVIILGFSLGFTLRKPKGF